MTDLLARIENLEQEVYGAVQEDMLSACTVCNGTGAEYGMPNNSCPSCGGTGSRPEIINKRKIDNCTWDLKDHIHVTSCRKTMLLPSWLVHNIEDINYCPYCGKPIKAVQ